MTKALGIFSGGLDSILAALLLRKQGVDVHCLCFVTPFFDDAKAQEMAARYDLPLQVMDISEEHLKMLKNPRYGYGKNMNPCIDCHAQMFEIAGRLMEEQGYDFLFSGEVLGQRPKSQIHTALMAVNKASGWSGRILRPLSAKLLPITPMEEQGLVDREQLEDIQGRSRKRQEALARELGVDKYPSSGGGCLLTENSFSGRLRDLFEHQPDCTSQDVELLKLGRPFRLSDTAKLTLGRNQSNNEGLKKIVGDSGCLLRNQNFSGPLGVVSGQASEEDYLAAAAIVASYGKGREEARVGVLIVENGQERVVEVAPMPREQVVQYQI
ncbi:thiamine biosynthesis protein [Desulfuromonas acetoxidans]|uniref:Thiamine biosynthesis protein n=1 Tax=Desulfuromonas acetoxidans (strain DSM 684 / 11070) TaxID=281689 RepID=Q1K1V6_DESA6|nr:thiamine biosynthesis protein [Desulfuromonas acetoxidans]EAT16683.1 thiamine biosynthesis protein [Desulfuromonas acetoxidans DSM 684]MBF0645819.1 thiamine biosynthesis protein [Desulfuromonas acetoxidans]NVD24793.1 thiamine biosynthesis protein [Desulfuromonas acetoxidans]NVE16838.1 thiamine biosynthesis protein [Desulfuromonas acetoxidans]